MTAEYLTREGEQDLDQIQFLAIGSAHPTHLIACIEESLQCLTGACEEDFDSDVVGFYEILDPMTDDEYTILSRNVSADPADIVDQDGNDATDRIRKWVDQDLSTSVRLGYPARLVGDPSSGGAGTSRPLGEFGLSDCDIFHAAGWQDPRTCHSIYTIFTGNRRIASPIVERTPPIRELRLPTCLGLKRRDEPRRTAQPIRQRIQA